MNFELIFNSLKDDIANCILSTYKNYPSEIKDEIISEIETSRGILEKWTIQLIGNEITHEEFIALVSALKDSYEVKALKRLGITMVEKDKLMIRIANSIINAIVKNL